MNTTAFSPASSSGRPERLQQRKDQPTADQRMKDALARIESSRSALIVCLSPDPSERRNRPDGGSGDGSTRQSFGQSLAARIDRNGLLKGSWRTVRALVRRWWTRQPWHSSVDLVGQTLAHEARPWMQRHPLATLAVGAAVGAGLVTVLTTFRPWAWRQIGAKGSPWGDRVGSLLWTQATSAPVQMALAGALAAWLADRGNRNAASSSPSGGVNSNHAHGESTANAAMAATP